MAQVPVAEGLFTWPSDEPSLIGGCCADCAAYTFPVRSGCPSCGSTRVSASPLAREGTLWTWTSQGFPPKPPFSGTFASDPFEPWFVGLIELPGQLRLESILTGCTLASLRIGMPMRLTTMRLRVASDGDEVITFAFAPASSASERNDDHDA